MIEGGGGEEGDGSPFMLRSNLILSQLLRQIRSRYHLFAFAFAFALYEPLLLSLQEILRGSLQLQQWIRTTGRRNDGTTERRVSAGFRCVFPIRGPPSPRR